MGVGVKMKVTTDSGTIYIIEDNLVTRISEIPPRNYNNDPKADNPIFERPILYLEDVNVGYPIRIHYLDISGETGRLTTTAVVKIEESSKVSSWFNDEKWGK
jgi:hypothetical protein